MQYYLYLVSEASNIRLILHSSVFPGQRHAFILKDFSAVHSAFFHWYHHIVCW